MRAVGAALVELDAREIPDDWSERWRRFHSSVLVEAFPRSQARQEPHAGVGQGVDVAARASALGAALRPRRVRSRS